MPEKKTSSTDKVIDVRDLHVRVDEKQVLKGVSFFVTGGEITVIAGASGAGKSLLLKTLIGLQPFQHGSVKLLRREVSGIKRTEWPEMRRRVGIVFQGNALFDSLPVWRNVGFSLLYHREKPEREVRDLAQKTLKLVGLDGIAETYPDKLSGGMQKRVALARTLVSEPQVVLFDEPTVGLDPTTSESIEDLVMELRDKLGTTSLVVTHDQHFTFRVADRVGLLHQGEISFFGRPSEIESSPDPVVKGFFREEIMRCLLQEGKTGRSNEKNIA